MDSGELGSLRRLPSFTKFFEDYSATIKDSRRAYQIMIDLFTNALTGIKFSVDR